jgi:3-hydroxypropanoate dehydrogenase
MTMTAVSSSAHDTVHEEAMARLFTEARTHATFEQTPLDPALLQRIHELASLGPTSMNCQPARFLFVTSAEARERLLPHIAPGNMSKVRSAPVTVIVARDTRFFEWMPTLWHAQGAREDFERQPELARSTAVRNATLTAAYFILAARALGLACGPMSGFDEAGINSTFFPDQQWEVDFLINLGYPANPAPSIRKPRLTFSQACRVL